MPSRHIDDEVKDGERIYVPLHLCDSVQRRAFGFNPRDHQPGFRDADRCRKAYARYCADAGLSPPDPDAATQKSPYENYKAALSNAWRGQSCTPYTPAPDDLALARRLAPLLGLAPPMRASSAPLDPAYVTSNYGRQRDGTDDRRAAYDQMVRRATDAWRDGITIEPGGGDLESAIAKAIESATDPDAAVEHEKELERWQGRPIAELTAAVETRRKAIHTDYAARLSNAWRGA